MRPQNAFLSAATSGRRRELIPTKRKNRGAIAINLLSTGGIRNPILRLPLAGIPLFCVYLAFQMVIGTYSTHIPVPLRPGVVSFVYIVAAALMIFAYRGLIHLTERRSAKELEVVPSHWTLSGFLIGAALLFGTQIIAVVAGFSHIDGYSGVMHAIPVFFAAGFAAIGEEVIFRGIIFRLIKEAGGVGLSVVASALIFGGLHALNPGATIVGISAIAIEAGILLALAYQFALSLWFPIGLHLGWNFFEGGVFGGSVSGTGGKGILTVSTSGPVIWTGGMFGLEASLQAVLLCSGASVVLAMGICRRSKRTTGGFRVEKRKGNDSL